MTGSRPGYYWLFCWKFVSPIAMAGILIATVADIAINGSGYKAWVADKGVESELSWPLWSQLLILFLIGISVIWIPVVALLRYVGAAVACLSKGMHL